MRWRLIALVAAIVMILAACGGDDDSDGASSGGSDSTAAGNAESGQVWYDGTCSTCHGQAGVGIEGLGKPLIASTFVAERSDADMIAFIKVGRPAADPENTTGVDMPPKGGNPSLDEQQLADIVAYLRTL